jgi:hypothetical protein
MASGTEKGPNKTAFVREFLSKSPAADHPAVNRGWAEAGNEGTVSESLVQKLRSEAGLTAKARKGRTASANGPAKAPRSKQKSGKPTAATREAGRPRDQGKSFFIKEVLVDDPRANAKAVNEAWRRAGMAGSISGTLVSMVRSELGLAGNRRGRPKGAENATARAAKPGGRSARPGGTGAAPDVRWGHRSIDRERVLAEIEADIDRVIFRLMAVGGLGDVEDELRAVRRRLVVLSHRG